MFKKDELVTVRLDENNNASNTYKVYGHIMDDEGSVTDVVALYHPLQSDCLIVRHIDELNKVQGNLKDSTERSLEFATLYQHHLDHNSKGELEALKLFFVVNRTLTNRQKNQLSNICGVIASIYFHNDINMAMDLVRKNAPILSPFNEMWYNNFKDLFLGKKPIVSPKQRNSIFNIAGSVLAELQRSETQQK